MENIWFPQVIFVIGLVIIYSQSVNTKNVTMIQRACNYPAWAQDNTDPSPCTQDICDKLYKADESQYQYSRCKKLDGPNKACYFETLQGSNADKPDSPIIGNACLEAINGCSCDNICKAVWIKYALPAYIYTDMKAYDCKVYGYWVCGCATVGTLKAGESCKKRRGIKLKRII